MIGKSVSIVLWFLIILTFASRKIIGVHARSLSDTKNPPTGALIVRKSGTKTGEYSTLTEAVAALSNKTGSQVIFIYPGTYDESVRIQYDSALTIQGYTESSSSFTNNQVTVQHSNDAQTAGSDEKSSVIWTSVKNFKMFNINVVNTYGPGTQAIAMTADGDQQEFGGCKFEGYQDTLYVRSSTSYYEGCEIIGGVDFIFGDGTAWFEQCTIGINPSPTKGVTIITAQKSPGSGQTRFVFNNSTVVAAGNSSLVNSTYLGRPWSEYATVTFQYCTLPNLINPKGWSSWNTNDTRTAHIEFLEYQNTGDGAATGSRVLGLQATAALSLNGTVGSDPSTWN